MPIGGFIKGEGRCLGVGVREGDGRWIGYTHLEQNGRGGGGKERTGCGNDVTHQEDWTGLSVLDDGDSSDILIGLFIANPLYQNGKEFIII